MGSRQIPFLESLPKVTPSKSSACKSVVAAVASLLEVEKPFFAAKKEGDWENTPPRVAISARGKEWTGSKSGLLCAPVWVTSLLMAFGACVDLIACICWALSFMRLWNECKKRMRKGEFTACPKEGCKSSF